MSSPGRAATLSPEFRAGLFHSTVFLSAAATSAYFSIWLRDKGLQPSQIGVITALPILLLLLINVVVGRLADRASDWRQAIITMAMLAMIAPFALFFVNGFWGILIVWTLFTVPGGAIPPVIDAATLRMTQRNGTSFSLVRAWGTVGYTVGTAVCGLVVAMLGGIAFVPIILVVALLRAGLSLQLPRFRAPPHEPVARDTTVNSASRFREMLQPWFVLPLLAFGLLQGGHAILANFTSLIWQQQGIPEGYIGLLLALSPAAEATTMFLWRRLGGRYSARSMLLFASLVAVLRWTVMAASPPIAVLALLQLLHSITYAVAYFSTVHFIAKWTRENIAAEAQGFAAAIQQALSAAALIIFGGFAQVFGSAAFLASAAMALVAVVCVVVSLKLKPASEEALQKL